MIEIGIQTDSLLLIQAGLKTIEGRLAKPRFIALKPGDMVSVREDLVRDGKPAGSRPHVAWVVVTHVERFDSFREMLETLGYKKFRPHDASIDEALKTYRKFYTAAEEREHGVVAVSFFVRS